MPVVPKGSGWAGIYILLQASVLYLTEAVQHELESRTRCIVLWP
jgi:hypothetical protein